MIAPMDEEPSPWWDVAIAVVPALVAATAILVPWAVDRYERKRKRPWKRNVDRVTTEKGDPDGTDD